MEIEIQAVQLGDHTWALGGPFAWVYLVRTNTAAVLLDTGMTFMAPSLLRQVEHICAGVPLKGILLTHSHFDHVGCAAALESHFATEWVGMHAGTERVLSNPKAVALIAMLNDQVGQMTGADVPVFAVPKTIRVVEGGSRIDVDSACAIRIWGTPGHTRDSISFEVLPDGLVVMGEACGVPITSLKHIQVEFLTSWQEYLAGIEVIQALKPQYLGLPHGLFAVGAEASAEYLRDSQAATLRYVERLQNYMAETKGDFQTVFDRVYREDYAGGQIGQPEPAYRLNLEAQVRLMQRQYQDSRV